MSWMAMKMHEIAWAEGRLSTNYQEDWARVWWRNHTIYSCKISAYSDGLTRVTYEILKLHGLWNCSPTHSSTKLQRPFPVMAGLFFASFASVFYYGDMTVSDMVNKWFTRCKTCFFGVNHCKGGFVSSINYMHEPCSVSYYYFKKPCRL